MDDAFETIEDVLHAGGPAAGFDFLARKFREEKSYRLLFEARLMKRRHELGLPLIQTDNLDTLPPEVRRTYEEAFIEAAREVGGLFLADGDIPNAWPYFRAIGEPGPVAAAIEKVEPREGIEPIIEIAFLEGVHPYKGFELILAHHGICRAITSFEQYPNRQRRDDCARLLVRTLHRELVERLKHTIAQAEGQAPETENVTELVAGRDWLFGEYSYYVDTSHLMSVLRFSAELEDPETLVLAVELSEYGKRLSSQFQYRGEPPFENVSVDYGVYLRALLGQNADEAVAHFRNKVAASDPNEVGTAPAQVLVALLARLKRYHEAIEVSLEHLREVPAGQLACPSVLQLCQLAGDYRQLMDVARQQQDLLSFAAGALQA